jgi:orotate phosphoribosyltransferase
MSQTQNKSRGDLARKIYELSHLTGEFKLRSGAVSHEYFDKYLFEADPAVLREIAHALAPLVPDEAEVLAGLETGGIPIATMLSQETGLPTCFVRKKAKDYGTAKLAEGAEVKGKKVVIVEDVVTSGGQILLSAADLRAAGAEIIAVLCVIDREAGGPEKLQEKDLSLSSLFTMRELNDAVA